MKEKGRDILKKAIQELPEFSFDSEMVWTKIDESLGHEHSITDKQLPEFSLPKDIWPEIEQSLETNHRRKIYLAAARIAASLVFLLGIGLLLKDNIGFGEEKVAISYSTETVEDQSFVEDDFPVKIQGDEHLQLLCQNNPEACTSPLFIELTKQIDEIVTEMNKISDMAEKNNDPQILRYYYQLENQKVEIELQMLKIINQS